MRGLILCAGLGERLRPLTLTRAKPAIEFLNVPMLGFPYFWLNRVSLTDAVFNTHYLPDSIRHAAMHVVNPNTQMHFTQEDSILGSGGGIWNARFHLQWDTDFAVANGDGVVTFAEFDAVEQMLRFHREKNALATLLVCPLEGVGKKIPGVWQDKFGEVTNFGKIPRHDYLECLHYASFMFMSERLWKSLPEGSSNILYDVLEPAIARGEKVYGYRVAQMRWFETGNVADYLRATRECLEMIRANDRMGQSLRSLLDELTPNHVLKSNFAQRHLIDDASEISPTARLEGFVVVGAGARIDDNALVENCVVLPGAHVVRDSVNQDTVII